MTTVLLVIRTSASTFPGSGMGGAAWKVRFTPSEARLWTFVTHFTDTAERGLHGRKGTVRVSPPAGEKNPLYRHGGFLKVSSDRRFLTHTDGTSFFWLADTWWFCPSDLMPIDGSNRAGINSTFKTLVDLRSKQGFNVFHWAFNGTIEIAGTKHTFNELLNGVCQPAYRRKVDRYFAYANEKGFIPVFGFGWENIYYHVTYQQVRRLWRYVLARYGAYAASFLICGEYNRPNLHQGEWEHNEFSRRRTKLLIDIGTFIYQSEQEKKFNNWGPTIPWWKAMKAPGAEHMKHMKEIYHAAKWWGISPRPEGIEPADRALVRANGTKTFLFIFPATKKRIPGCA